MKHTRHYTAQMIGLIWVGSFSAAAQTTPECGRTVVDRAAAFSDQQQHSLEESAGTLRQRGADVHLLTVSIPPGSDMDSAVQAVFRNCPAWQGDAGAELKDNLIFLAAAPSSRATEIRFGSRWSSALSGSWQSVMADNMNPAFRHGDVVGGFVAGGRGLRRKLLRHLLLKPSKDQ